MPGLIDGHSFLLGLPTELRLRIYDYCLADANIVTITAAPLSVFGHQIRDTARPHIHGLPRDFSPLVRYCYDPDLLSLKEPPTIALDAGKYTLATSCEHLPYSAPFALLQSCALIHDELDDYMRSRRPGKDAGGLSLYATYPYGVLVFQQLYPFLLRQATNVYISGYHTPKTSGRPVMDTFTGQAIPRTFPRRARPWSPPRAGPSTKPLPQYSGRVAEAAPLALGKFVKSILSTDAGPLKKLEARILFFGVDSGAIWAEDDSPINHILRCTRGGNIDMNISRGAHTNAIDMSITPDLKSRTVTARWSNLDDRNCLDFVIGSHWPEAS